MKKWIIGIIIIISLVFLLLFMNDYKDESVTFLIIIGVIVFELIWVFVIFLRIPLLLYFFGGKIGRNKARKEFEKETEKIVLENPYMYFRDIPNKYGIGVALSILNYKVEKDDVLAGILDLAAKGYIIFKQNDKSYEIIETLKDRNGLLKNERYLLDWILNKDVKKIQMKEWLMLAKEDSINLGLGIINGEKKEYKPLFNGLDIKFAKKLFLITTFISLIINVILCHELDGIFEILGTLIMLTPIMSGYLWFIIFIICVIICLIYEGKTKSYNEKLNNKLILTEIGKKEYQELYSFGKFLNDFGNFTDKKIKEIVIWEQYLSYALMFGISDKILKTGYKDLLINECFVINDIDKLQIF